MQPCSVAGFGAAAAAAYVVLLEPLTTRGSALRKGQCQICMQAEDPGGRRRRRVPPAERDDTKSDDALQDSGMSPALKRKGRHSYRCSYCGVLGHNIVTCAEIKKLQETKGSLYINVLAVPNAKEKKRLRKRDRSLEGANQAASSQDRQASGTAALPHPHSNSRNEAARRHLPACSTCKDEFVVRCRTCLGSGRLAKATTHDSAPSHISTERNTKEDQKKRVREHAQEWLRKDKGIELPSSDTFLGDRGIIGEGKNVDDFSAKLSEASAASAVVLPRDMTTKCKDCGGAGWILCDECAKAD
ncbi:hypothetical protein FVE85_3136 [Porphyridium purpureum]|uniref:Uncharacterized protein n=1 Tax=Porphyridium purpureum TaxID=35688 RepID=A0A5J4YUH0_PORPP|nr:hypothetical protein FVE85_3136 [Porphyridium purpureum]|eukprot:POR0132..scf227_4